MRRRDDGRGHWLALFILILIFAIMGVGEFFVWRECTATNSWWYCVL